MFPLWEIFVNVSYIAFHCIKCIIVMTLALLQPVLSWPIICIIR